MDITREIKQDDFKESWNGFTTFEDGYQTYTENIPVGLRMDVIRYNKIKLTYSIR